MKRRATAKHGAWAIAKHGARTLVRRGALAFAVVTLACAVSSSAGDGDSSGGSDATSQDGSRTDGASSVGDGGSGSGSSMADAYEEDDGGTGCSFTCPDPPPPPATTGGGGGPGGGIECDLLAQDCPEGEKCMPWANDGGIQWNATRCSPIAEHPGHAGDPCTVEGSGVSGVDDCDLAAWCIGVDPETNKGTCAALCSGDPDNPLCDDPDLECGYINGFIPLCGGGCDPFLQNCDADQGCYFVLGVFSCYEPIDMPAAAGEPCGSQTGCEPGALCVFGQDCGNEPGQGCCATVCDATDAGSCSAGTCVSWLPEPAPPEYAHIGICEGA